MSAQTRLLEKVPILGPNNSKGKCEITYECRAPHCLHCKLFGHWSRECEKLLALKKDKELQKKKMIYVPKERKESILAPDEPTFSADLIEEHNEEKSGDKPAEETVCVLPKGSDQSMNKGEPVLPSVANDDLVEIGLIKQPSPMAEIIYQERGKQLSPPCNRDVRCNQALSAYYMEEEELRGEFELDSRSTFGDKASDEDEEGSPSSTGKLKESAMKKMGKRGRPPKKAGRK